tara:strand:- start:1640 stop:1795 length:156 start_codon:yes stop_codon:yes gene_type:complete
MYITDTKVDMQNELQWWGEQKLQAIQEGDLLYSRECEKNIQKLLKDIQHNG